MNSVTSCAYSIFCPQWENENAALFVSGFFLVKFCTERSQFTKNCPNIPPTPPLPPPLPIQAEYCSTACTVLSRPSQGRSQSLSLPPPPLSVCRADPPSSVLLYTIEGGGGKASLARRWTIKNKRRHEKIKRLKD